MCMVDIWMKSNVFGIQENKCLIKSFSGGFLFVFSCCLGRWLLFCPVCSYSLTTRWNRKQSCPVFLSLHVYMGPPAENEIASYL